MKYDLKSQLSGIYNIPGTYTSIASAITALNTQGVNGAVTINIASGYTETAPLLGYSLTATGTATNTITFQKNGAGANPLVTAYSGGTATPSSALQDGIWRLIGCDYITIDGVDLVDLNTSNPATMEFGYGLFKASGTNGSQNNCIKNCVITLNRNNTGAGTGYVADGSRGIEIICATSQFHIGNVNSPLVGSANSFNKIYSNIIQNCNIGISINSAYSFTGGYDEGNDIGGNSILTGNIIRNYGGGTGAIYQAAAILASDQRNFNISYNLINNNNGSGVSHIPNLYGMRVLSSDSLNRTITNNTITLNSGGTSSSVYAIENSGGNVLTIKGFLNISNNLITNCTFPAANATGSVYGIINGNIASYSVNIDNNSFLNNSAALVNNYRCIQNSGSGSGNVSISNNLISGISFTNTTFKGIYIGSAWPTSTISVSSNSIQGINYLGSSSSNFDFIYNVSDPAVINFKKNKLNVSLSTKGGMGNIYNFSSAQAINVDSNSIVNFVSTATVNGGSSGYYGSSSSGVGKVSITNNDFSNVTLNGNGNYMGITSAGTNSLVVVTNNTISVVSASLSFVNAINFQLNQGKGIFSNNVIKNINANSFEGFGVLSTTSSTASVFSNTVNSIFTLVKSVGIDIGNVANLEIKRNKIYDITTNTDEVIGIMANSVGNTAINNNLVGDFKTVSGFSVTGIYMPFSLFTSTFNVAFNSIYLNATSSATDFGSNGIYHYSSTLTTQGSLHLNNNIIVNTSIPTGIGLTCALFRDGPQTTANYDSTSNNNIFFVNGTSPSRKEYFNGLFYSSFTAMKTAIQPRESNTVLELPPFLSTIGANPNFLKIDPFIPTQVESGAVPIIGIIDDYGLTIRNTLTPDIGAWENNYTLKDLKPPTITGINKTSGSCNLTSETFTANIIDASGVAGSTLSPRCYFKINSGPFSSTSGTLTSGNNLNGNWSFGLNYVASSNDVLHYYFVSQDIASPTNIGSIPNIGLVASSVNSITSPPSSLFSDSIVGVLNGTYSVGVGGNFSTLTSAARAYNRSCLTGPVTFLLTDPTYAAENFPIIFIDNPDANSTNTLLIRPASAQSVSITVNSTSGDGIYFVDADYITIDGINNSGTDLTLVNTNTFNSITLWVASTGTTNVGYGCNNIGISNIKLYGNDYTNDKVLGIAVGSYNSVNAVSGPGVGNNNIVIKSNILENFFTPLSLSSGGIGNDALYNSNVEGNIIGPAISGSNNIGGNGILLSYVNSSTIKNNLIRNITTKRVDIAGILIIGGDNVSISSNTLTSISSSTNTYGTNSITGIRVWNSLVTNLKIEKNVISSIFNNSPSGYYGARGLSVQTALLSTNNKITNNMISDIYSRGGQLPNLAPIGIALEPSASPNLALDNNSIYLSGNHSGDIGLHCTSAAVYVGMSDPNLKIRNNIFSNTYDLSSSLKSICYSIYTNGIPAIGAFNNNNYYVAGTADSLVLGNTSSASLFNLSAIQSTYGQNSNSKNVAPIFVSATDLHLTGSNPSLDNTALPLPALSQDIDNQVRNISTPDIGADEFFSFPCSTVSGITQTVSSANICNGQTTSFNSAGGSGTGLSYQWMVSSTPSGPYTNVIGGIGAATTNYSTSALSTGTFYYVMQTTCSSSSLSAVSNEATVTISPIPTSSISSNMPICSGQSLILNGGSNIGTLFNWNGPNSFTSAIQNPTIISSSTLNSGVYSLTVTQGICSSTTTTSISIITPTISVSNTGPYCIGNPIQLNTYSALSYSWTGPGGFSSNLQNPSISSSTTTMSGVYNLVASLGSCTASANTSVSVNILPVVSALTSNSILCTGQNSTLSASGANFYLWNPGGSTATIVVVSPTINTTYSVTGTDMNGCFNSASLTQTISACTGIEFLINNNENYLIYPNPSNGEFIVLSGVASVNVFIEVFDILGNVIEKRQINESYFKLDLRMHSSGIYFVRISDNHSVVYSAKLIKQ